MSACWIPGDTFSWLPKIWRCERGLSTSWVGYTLWLGRHS